jgi:hypothetical protein
MAYEKECPVCSAPKGQPCRELVGDHQRIMRKGHKARKLA